MADFNKPQLSDPYGDVLQAVRALLAECARFQDGSSNTNVPTGAVRFSSTNRRFERWNGVSWVELIPKASSMYDINVDRVDGYDAGNGNGQIPVSNGTVNTNLNADLLDGNHASAFALAPVNGQDGVRRLYRNDDGSAYNVQTYWTGTRWRLRGYLNDTFHAEAEVARADTAGTADNANAVGGLSAAKLQFSQSSRDFTSGTLIQTDIDYSQTNGEPWLLEIEGNSYGSAIPFDIKVQGYIYSDTIIYYGGFSNGTSITGLVAFNFGGMLCFWFPRQGYWQGFSIYVNDSLAGARKNRLTSINDAAKPSGISKEVALSSSIRQSWHSGNFYPGTKANASTSLQKSGDTASELYNNGWFRSNGNVGWYSQTYDGGIWMSDASWLRVYGNKGFLTNWHQFHSGGNIWTSSYGWLHDRFAPSSTTATANSAIQNCASSAAASSSAWAAGYQASLFRSGTSLTIGLTAVNCVCACGW